MKKYVVWFNQVDKNDLEQVGGKGANLGEMTKIGIPVPNGFIVTAQAYFDFLEQTNIKNQIEKLLFTLDVSDSHKLQKVAIKIQKLVAGSSTPKTIAEQIIKAYLKLGKVFHEPLVAVRSSATAEDLPTASFAGQQATFLNVKGEASLVHHVKLCWASLFTARAIFYRVEQKFAHFKVGIAVPVQIMVQSEKSGIMFTVDPVSGDKNSLVIEAIYGLGEMIVQGLVTPDQYVVNKKKLQVVMKHIGVQEKQMFWQKNHNIIKNVNQVAAQKQKISDERILQLAVLGKQLEKHYYFPQDIEWAIEKNKVYITQTRPITTLPEKRGKISFSADKHELKHTHVVLLKGDAASPGVASGPVKVIKSARQIDQVKNGEILVASQTNPDFVPAMRKVVAIVTEKGGRTSHAAIVSRELGIPAVVGVKDATKKLTNGLVVTVHGSQGVIYKGGILKSAGIKAEKDTLTTLAPSTTKIYQPQKTATKVLVNLANPQQAHQVAEMNVDGVGLLRAEFMIAGIGIHPKKFIKDKRKHDFVNQLSQNLAIFCRAFYPRPVVYRATDFRTNEYRNLIGGDEFEPQEDNPMLGYRGAFRYISDPQVFDLELLAIKQIRNKLGLKNLWLMIPFVHTPEEMKQVKKMVASQGLVRSHSFKLWMMVELPANVILLEEFIQIGIDGVSIGSNDLTMLILGIDRDNSQVSQVFDERNPAVLWALEKVITTCNKYHITSSICGQAPSDYPELVEKLVEWGITSISINRDVVNQVRDIVYIAENKLLTKKKGKI